MKHETRFILLLVSCLLLPYNFNGVWANDGSVSRIQSVYNSINDLKADFTQTTYVEVLETTMKDRGIFMMKRPNKLRIEYKGTQPKNYISNGKKLWVIDPTSGDVETHLVSRSVPKEALELLSGFAEMEKLFNVSRFTPKKPQTKYTYLSLKPKAADVPYSKLDCSFGADGLLRQMTIHNKSGNVSKYVFNNIELNSGLKDGLFTK